MEFKHIFYIFCCIWVVIINLVIIKVPKNLKRQSVITTCLLILTFTFYFIWEKENLAVITFGLTGILFRRTIAQIARRHYAWRNFRRVKRKAKLHISWKEPEQIKNSFQEIMCLITGIVFVILGLLGLLKSGL
jgi:hypothetical protein